ncbi:MAG: effector binding domain-containing protein [Thermaceae bacterium]|nr:effector binding domain-containing protein [Thermaceae bacterium]
MQKPVSSRENGFYVLGMETRTTNALEANPATAKIGALWGQVRHESLMESISKRMAKGKMFGVYYDYESDENGAYSLLVGYQVPDLSDVPSGLKGVVIEDSRYLVFTAEGDMPGALTQTWQYIWDYFKQPGSKRAFSYDYEVYESYTRVSVYIAIR